MAKHRNSIIVGVVVVPLVAVRVQEEDVIGEAVIVIYEVAAKLSAFVRAVVCAILAELGVQPEADRISPPQ